MSATIFDSYYSFLFSQERDISHDSFIYTKFKLLFFIH